ncbi:MAG: bifunctional aldolase/short-chain dehydrogenase [Candidatus Omnitrophota bacterium]|nr:bifunctional aldolase/short-chain dehydrogenase [Candidatus Omnitrophota bacterium]MDZ4243207.1 bifunctional aldolase/short-chain dehydrogenase [Candidatus Omnitrophota bacterium]
MNNLWNDQEAAGFKSDPLKLRVYTSRLLGREPDLVLHGGGNTSVKVRETNAFGEEEELLYVKGSGWDLASIEAGGFAPVKMDALLKMARLKELSDAKMVSLQRAAMTDPSAPNPSVEAILHAIIPFQFVDHTHADAVVAVSNTPDGEKRIREIYGPNVLVVPYVMPGFILARKVFEMTRDLDWARAEGMVLLHHGIFTFDNDAKASYEKMIRLVSKAEDYLKTHSAVVAVSANARAKEDLPELARLRRAVARKRGTAVLASQIARPDHVQFSNLPHMEKIAARGCLTPDHIIRTKRVPMIIKDDPLKAVESFAGEYQKYFDRNHKPGQVCLDPAPRWAVAPERGSFIFGADVKELRVISDITDHTIRAVQQAEMLGEWKALPEKDLFEMEYWELEQAKLKKAQSPPLFQGKVVMVTGAASGIGKACVEEFARLCAAVSAVDMDPKISSLFKKDTVLGIAADLTDPAQVKAAVEETVRNFGGLDIVVSNAGIFPPSETIAGMKPETWEKSLRVNLTSHQYLLTEAVPYLKEGLEPAVIVVGSKNVPAPGPGVSAYSVAKAGLTQLARVAALELAASGIRVNIVHPNQVFDTAIWTPEVLEKRAKHYGTTVEEYKKSNLLKTEITSFDVARLVCVMAGPVFAKTTGAQIPIDGGNDRVI